MNAGQGRQLLGFGLVAVGVLAAAVWVGFGTGGPVGGASSGAVVESRPVADAEASSGTVGELQQVAEAEPPSSTVVEVQPVAESPLSAGTEPETVVEQPSSTVVETQPVAEPPSSAAAEDQPVAEPPTSAVAVPQPVAVQPAPAPGALRWLPVAAAVFMLVGATVLFLSRPPPGMDSAAAAARDIVAALERQHDHREAAAALPEVVRSSLERLGRHMEDIGRKLDRHSGRLEQFATEMAEARRADDEGRTADDSGAPPVAHVRQGPADNEEPVAVDSPGSEDDEGPAPDLEQELTAAWTRYRDEGDGHFNARGLSAELAAGSIAAAVRKLGDDAGEAVLAIDDPRSSQRGFLVVPDFTRSPKSAERWFDDESGGRLGSRTNDIKKLARGRWTESGAEVVTKGSVA